MAGLKWFQMNREGQISQEAICHKKRIRYDFQKATLIATSEFIGAYSMVNQKEIEIVHV